MQTGMYSSLGNAFANIHSTTGITGFYRGFTTTVFREIPFTCIQFPLWEHMKSKLSAIKEDSVTPFEAAVCGSIAGGTAAAITTPLDVIKTRVMLSMQSNTKFNFITELNTIISQEGYSALLKGIGPRVMWISFGGFLFLGAFEQTLLFIK